MMINCKYCGEEIEKKNIKAHLEICQDIFIDCDNNCGKKIKKRELNNHKKICPESNVKCKFWEYGCKMNLKRKNYQNHLKNEINHHFNIIKHYLNNSLKENEENKKLLSIFDDLKNQIEEKEKEKNKDIEIIKLQEEIKKDPLGYAWNQELKKQKKNTFQKYYNNNIPFTGEYIKFFTDSDTFNNKIIFFEREKIIYNGNNSGKFEKGKYFFVFSQKPLDLNKNSDFSFRITTSLNNNLPWIAFGLYAKNINTSKSSFKGPEEGFYLIDFNSNTYYNGEFESYKNDYGKINIENVISLSYLPNENKLTIND